MPAEKDVQAIVDRVNAEELTELISELDGSDFGAQIPVYDDNGTIRMMLQGYSQVERDLVVSVGRNEPDDDALQIGWFGRQDGRDSSCQHDDHDRCRHCTGHTGACRHCTHPRGQSNGLPNAPGLDYHQAIQELANRQELLAALAEEGLGLTLVHGHNDEHMFTRLPEDYVSVVAGGRTVFRETTTVAQDPTFVPNTWRVVNGELNVAGGHSQLTDD
ncbi:MAG: hypothetical protein AAF358_04585 [Pseudomonadota bacterium]